MVCQRFLSPFPYYSDLFFYLFSLQGDLIFIFTSFSFLPDHQDFFLKKRKKRAHRWISICTNAFYSVFISSSRFSMIYSVLLLSHRHPLHPLHTSQILYLAKIPAYAPDIFPHQKHFFHLHPQVPYISYAL